MGNPIIEFKQRENDELKTTGGGNNQKPQFVLTGKELEQHITFLSGRLKDLEVDWEIYVKNNMAKVTHFPLYICVPTFRSTSLKRVTMSKAHPSWVFLTLDLKKYPK